MRLAMDRLLLSLVNTRLELPDPLETPLGAARWWATVQPLAGPAAVAVPGKPRFDAALASWLRSLRESLAGAMSAETPFEVRFTGIAQADAVLFPVAYAALTLLLSKRAKRIKACVRPACSRLFMDETKNGTKRWCSMRCMERARAPRRRTIVR